MLLVMILMIFGMRVKCNEWNDENNDCPMVLNNTSVSCTCDLPHTLRCTGDKNSLEYMSIPLAQLSNISLLDYTILNVTYIPARILPNITLHGLVITSGEIVYLHPDAFSGLNGPLQALGLPNNLLDQVPSDCLQSILSIRRLDLSHNRIRKLTDLSFKNLLNLTFLDLSNNLLGSISADAFTSIPKLQVLILRGNRISSSHMYSLQGLQSLRKLDLSYNVIVGPLHFKFAPGLPLLTWFSMSKNQLSSIKRDALSGFTQLTTLLLQDNHIDVIEDFAFRSISQLNYLDLSNNRIVAISNSSLAFLSKLSIFDISHNFLITVTNELISPLHGLNELHLDDNDISLISTDALHSVIHLNRLTISENPLNCDCSLIYFATWLNSSNLTQEDRSTAICATPPSFENALLADLSIEDLVCPSSTELLTSSSSSNYTIHSNSPFISLHAFNYVPSEVTLIWNIQKEMLPYTCDTLVTYEKLEAKEVLLESRHIECNSTSLNDATFLPVTSTSSVILDGHLYRFCITLIKDSSNAQSACSRVLAFSKNTNDIQTEIISEYIDKIEATLIKPDKLNVTLKMRDLEIEQCLLLIRIYNLDELLTQQTVNCSNIHVIDNLTFSLSYRICISFSNNNTMNPVCTWVYSNDVSRNNANHIVLVAALFLLFLLFIAIFLYSLYCTRCRFKKRLFTSNNYLFPPVTYNQENASYSKLQAVTTL